MNELYEPLIERDIDAFARIARGVPPEELWIAVARFAVLAYAPSQHGKRAVMACRAAYELRAFDFTVECARYAADSRQPWSEPPILDPPDAAPDLHGDIRSAEAWLGAHLDDAAVHLRDVVKGDARLMLDTALALEEPLGTKGRYALLRMVIHELFTETDDPSEPLDVLVDRAVEQQGAPDAVRAVFVRHSSSGARFGRESRPPERPPLHKYQLARDYAQTLIAHTITVPRQEEFLAAVHHNLEHGDSYADWTLA